MYFYTLYFSTKKTYYYYNLFELGWYTFIATTQLEKWKRYTIFSFENE